MIACETILPKAIHIINLNTLSLLKSYGCENMTAFTALNENNIIIGTSLKKLQRFDINNSINNFDIEISLRSVSSMIRLSDMKVVIGYNSTIQIWDINAKVLVANNDSQFGWLEGLTRLNDNEFISYYKNSICFKVWNNDLKVKKSFFIFVPSRCCIVNQH
jgi:hypothetical protein